MESLNFLVTVILALFLAEGTLKSWNFFKPCGRYGLVGRNGCGKSTMLRYISHRQIAYSPKLTVLHVEQEVRYFSLFSL